MTRPLEPLAAGERITESWLRTLVEHVLGRLTVRAVAPLEAMRDAGGVSLRLAWWHELRPFALTTALAQGGQAAAVLLTWQPSSSTYEQPSSPSASDVIQVFDALGTFSGASGKRGYTFFSRLSGRWEVAQLEC